MSLRCAQTAHRLGDDPAANAFVRDAVTASRRLADPGSIPARIAELQDRMAGIDLRVARLSPAEMRVLRQLATHRTLQEIAEHLHVSRPTVKTHVAAIYSKLSVAGRADAVAALGVRDEPIDLSDNAVRLGDTGGIAPALDTT